ncbi:MAG: Lon-like protease [Actinomycetota bacterium]|jgi:PDZ domain-containing protein|nr:Lon-like protease [Actinomycetota bacterium]
MQRDEFEPPQHPDAQPVKAVPVWRWVAISVLMVALTAAAIFVPIPIVFLYLPGPVRNVEELVKVSDGRVYSSEGALYMTTVSVDTDVSFVELIIAAISPDQRVVMKEDVTGGQSLEQLQTEQQAEMENSQANARQVAFSELGLDHPTGDGAKVVTTITGAPADGVLEPDDVIVAVDGEPIETTCDVGRAIDGHDTGDEITVTVTRDGRERDFDLKLVPNPIDGSPGFIGVQMRTVHFQFDPGVTVDFETGQIAGPSAGLMLSLALYDLLTPEDLTAGHQIAGTGTLECDGGVGPIGGIQQKVAGARAEGAEIFLAPLANVEEARAVAHGIKIVPIGTFDDAVEYLGGLE